MTAIRLDPMARRTTLQPSTRKRIWWLIGVSVGVSRPSFQPLGGMRRAIPAYTTATTFSLRRLQQTKPATRLTSLREPVTLGVPPGLLAHSPSSTGMQAEGGFVQVPFDDAINPSQFTLECWINPDIGTDDTNDPGNYYCVFETTGPPGPQGLGPKQAGIGLYIGPKDVPPKAPPGPYFWQVWMGDGKKLNQIAVSNDPVHLKQLTYLVLTFDGSQLQLFAYYPDLPPGQRQDCGNINSIRTLQKTGITTFKRNDTSNSGNGPFFIGAGSNLDPAAGVPKQRLYPFKGKIQGVALYNVDLSAPNNQGC